jgi:hypothetical protein
MVHMAPLAVRLFRHVDASRAAQYLMHLLQCERWHVVCNREHQIVVHLSRLGIDRYAVMFECTAPVDKAVYHGSWTSHFSIVPLEDEDELPGSVADQIRDALSHAY